MGISKDVWENWEIQYLSIYQDLNPKPKHQLNFETIDEIESIVGGETIKNMIYDGLVEVEIDGGYYDIYISNLNLTRFDTNNVELEGKLLIQHLIQTFDGDFDSDWQDYYPIDVIIDESSRDDLFIELD